MYGVPSMPPRPIIGPMLPATNYKQTNANTTEKSWFQSTFLTTDFVDKVVCLLSMEYIRRFAITEPMVMQLEARCSGVFIFPNALEISDAIITYCIH